MELQLRKTRNYTIIDLPKSLNFEVCLTLKAMMERLVSEDTIQVAINMAALDYIGSLGIGLITFTHKILKEAGGHCILIGPQDMVFNVLEQTKLTKIIQVQPTEEQLDV